MNAKPKRSVGLSGAEFRSLKRYHRQYRTTTECAESLGLSREVLTRVLLVGSGAPQTIEQIRATLAKEAIAA